MQVPTQNDINRIYEGFNQAYRAEPERYEFPDIRRFGNTDNGLRLGLNDSVAQGYWELYRPNDELLICLAEGHYHAPYSQAIVPTRDLVTLRFVLSGDYSLMFDNRDKVTIPPASASIIYTEEGRKFDLSIANDSHLSSVTLHMKPDFLYKGFAVERSSLPSHLQDVVFGAARDKNLYNFPLTPGMMNNILDLLRMPYQGVRRQVFTEAKTAELICRLFQEIEDDFEALPVLATPAHTLKMKLYEAQRILVANYRAPLTIAALARKVGLNRTLLCTEFREMFGVTVAEFAQNYRMNKARELLKDRNLSISQVAEAVGYEHPTNFTAAFKKQFGVLPKVIRSL